MKHQVTWFAYLLATEKNLSFENWKQNFADKQQANRKAD